MRLEDLDYDLPARADRAAPRRAPRGRAPAGGGARGRGAARLAHRRAGAVAASRATCWRSTRRACVPARLDVRRAERRARRAAVRAARAAEGALARAGQAREEGAAGRACSPPTTAASTLEVVEVGRGGRAGRARRARGPRPRRCEAHGARAAAALHPPAARARGPRALPDRLRAGGRRGGRAHGGAALHATSCSPRSPARGVARVPLLLHVGPGTFRPDLGRRPARST